jgi:UDP-N-acetylglucosamine--N-acetylmuramyl-(pentapeptide) pyrophosphoryl-undecaprenol N-acetylglucosamine transferase
MSKTVLIAAGGTGGHLFPAAAFAEEMRARGWRVVLMTDARGRQYAKNFPADAIEDVPAATFAGANPLKYAGAAVKILSGIRAAAKRLKALDPAIIAGFGGYPSLPALAVARMQKRPILIHEQNSVLGRVNRVFAPNAALIASGFERLDKLPPRVAARHVVTGNPVRAPILMARDAGFPIAPAGGALHLLVIGGSQGARLFGQVIPEAVLALPEDLRKRLHITQQAREEQVAEVKAAYDGKVARADVASFFTDMGERLKSAHLVIGRAGASTITELQVAGRPAILVPLKIATDDHQTGNAAALSAIGAADVIAEDDFTPARLAPLLRERLGNPQELSVRAATARASGKTDAVKKLADAAERLAAR